MVAPKPCIKWNIGVSLEERLTWSLSEVTAGNGKGTFWKGIVKDGWMFIQQNVRMALVKGFSLLSAMSTSPHIKTLWNLPWSLINGFENANKSGYINIFLSPFQSMLIRKALWKQYFTLYLNSFIAINCSIRQNKFSVWCQGLNLICPG